jgi:putative PIN family toxin of toxin-antitoxin system
VSVTPKVVVDTQVFLRALINPKSRSGILAFDRKDDYQLYTTEIIRNEVLEVLNRPSVRNKFPQITDDQVEIVEAILVAAAQVEIKPEDILPICRDPKDDIFLACAKAAHADYLVSEDQDLLVLENYAGAKIVNVPAFLAALEGRRDTPAD